jgi:hypothetical protein
MIDRVGEWIGAFERVELIRFLLNLYDSEVVVRCSLIHVRIITHKDRARANSGTWRSGGSEYRIVTTGIHTPQVATRVGKIVFR